MNQSAKDRLAAHTAVIKALAHPSRLLIVRELGRGPRCVFELTNLVGARMPTVSRHLDVLRHAGLVTAERRGARMAYRLLCPHILKFLEGVNAVVRGNARRSAVLAD